MPWRGYILREVSDERGAGASAALTSAIDLDCQGLVVRRGTLNDTSLYKICLNAYKHGLVDSSEGLIRETKQKVEAAGQLPHQPIGGIGGLVRGPFQPLPSMHTTQRNMLLLWLKHCTSMENRELAGRHVEEMVKDLDTVTYTVDG